MKNENTNQSFFSWGLSKLKSIASTSVAYVKNLFVSEDSKELHVAAGAAVIVAAAYNRLPQELQVKKLNTVFASTAVLSSMVSAAKTMFALGANYQKARSLTASADAMKKHQEETKKLADNNEELKKINNQLQQKLTTLQTECEVLTKKTQQQTIEHNRLHQQISQNGRPSSISFDQPGSRSTLNNRITIFSPHQPDVLTPSDQNNNQVARTKKF